MLVSDFDYDLPENLIAIHPPKVRGSSRLLVLDKSSSQIEHRQYSDFIDYLNPGDVVVLNNTKVIKARLFAKNTKGQKRELLLLEDHHNTDFNRRKAVYRGKMQKGEELSVGSYIVTVEEVQDGGIAIISSSTNLLKLAQKQGLVPLPPYLHRDATKEDIERYQTVFAKELGSVAAPTASLNFTEELEQKLRDKGIAVTYLTLHVGLGTFLPIRVDDLQRHLMHSEYFEIPFETTEIIKNAKLNSSNIVAVGTTVTRTLEYNANQILGPKSPRKTVLSGEANIFIYPGYKFKLVDSMLTNFHAPKSTVLMMAAAFAASPKAESAEQRRSTGWDNLKNAYTEAIKEKYSLLSYGDSMLIK